jgi:hypothetical protein
VLAQKEVRFDQIGKDLIVQDFKRLEAEAPRKAPIQRLNMGQLRVDAMIWRRSTHGRIGVLAHVRCLIPHIYAAGAALTAWRNTSDCPWLDVRLIFMQGERGELDSCWLRRSSTISGGFVASDRDP